MLDYSKSYQVTGGQVCMWKNSGIKQGKFCDWYGMFALIFAYFLVSFGWLDGQGLNFQLINLTGGVGLLIVAASKGVTQSVILNFFWAIISVIAITKIFFS